MAGQPDGTVAVICGAASATPAPVPRPLAARLPRLDVLVDTSGEQDAELARLGRGRLRRVAAYPDVAPAPGAIFAPH